MAGTEREALEDRVAPTGREARLWRVLVELSRSVADASAEANPETGAGKPKPLAPGHLERIVFEFDEAYTAFVEGMLELPSEAQLMSLQSVDRQLAAMVRAQDAELWTQRALREDLRWKDVQRLATGAVEAFAWPALRLALVSTDPVMEAERGLAEYGGTPGAPRRRS